MIALPSQYKAVSLAGCDTGTFFCKPSNSGGTPPLAVLTRVAGQEGTDGCIVWLSGERAFSTMNFAPHSGGRVLPVHSGEVFLELQSPLVTVPHQELPGHIVFAEDGPFLVTSARDAHGFGDLYFVRISDWTILGQRPEGVIAEVAIWRLVAVDKWGHKEQIVSQGDWQPA